MKPNRHNSYLFQNAMFQIQLGLSGVARQLGRPRQRELEVVVLHVLPVLRVGVRVWAESR